MEPSANLDPSVPFEVVLVEDDGVEHRAIFRGELDAATSVGLAETLGAIAHSALVADLSELTFIDSCGVGSLLTAKEHIESSGNTFILTRPSQPVRRVFELLGLEELFDHHANPLRAQRRSTVARNDN